MKVFLDTNILIDLVCKRQPFYNDAKRVFALANIGQIDILLSALSIVNTMYIGKKYELAVVRQRIKTLLPFVSVLDLPSDAVIKALDSDWKDYEDYIQTQSALEYFADCIITRNKKDFNLSSVPVYTVDEFMTLTF